MSQNKVKHAQCPRCGTPYRVDPALLGLANGMVRCGRCRAVFNARSAGSGTGPAVEEGGATGRPQDGPWPAGGALARVGGLLLATRNLVRHRRRTGLALSAIGFGVVALVLAGGFMEWIFWAMRESTILAQLGHIQIVRSGYLEEGVADPFHYLLPPESPLLSEARRLPHVKVVTPRLSFSGLLSRGESTVSFIGQGVVPSNEVGLTKYMKVIVGSGLSDDDPQGITVGRGLGEALGLAPGDTVVLLARTSSGGLNAVEVRVNGLFRTATKAYDDAAIRVPLDLARGLLRVDGAHQWVVLLNDTVFTQPTVEALAARLGRTDQGLDLVPWYKLADFYNKTVQLFSRQLNVMRAIIGLIIVLSISNILVMAVMERTAEIGTLMAVGLRRRAILRLFLTEGLLLGLVGGIAGVSLGVLLALVISAIGIPMPPPPGMGHGVTGHIFVTPAIAVGGFLLALLTTLVASVYPAWKASRLVIVDALRRGR